MNFTFFSEGPEHTRFFMPLLEKLKLDKNNLTLITLNNKDPLIKSNLFNNVFTPKNNFEKIKILKNIKSEFLITTTPGVGYSYFPKSKIWPKSERPKYVYLFHSLVSPNEMYSENSFKNFDIIYAPSEKIKNQLSYLVSKDTKIFTSGYLLFDKIQNEAIDRQVQKNILIAPTWGDSGLINDVAILEKIRNLLSQQGYTIHLRPHPMSIKNIKLIESLQEFELDLTPEVSNFHLYDFLITDYSGIALEYYFYTRRPSLFIETKKKRKRKLSSSEVNLVLIEEEMQNIIGEKFNIENSLEQTLSMLSNHNVNNEFIEDFHNKEGAAKFISNHLQKINKH